MKARLLKQILNDTKYTVNNNTDYIAVGSPLCHDLISVNKKTLKLKYALDTWNEGRAGLVKEGKDEILFIWDKLQELIDNGQIKDIIEGSDIIENPLPVYTVKNGELIESFTDKYGWPNTTMDGFIMYENEWYKTREEAIEYGISEYTAGLSILERRKRGIQDDLNKLSIQIQDELVNLEKIKRLTGTELLLNP
jgi:hypothetical protein